MTYYRLTTPDGEQSGTREAVRAAVLAYQAAGGTRYCISGPFSSPPPYRPPAERRNPPTADWLCLACFSPFARHTYGPDWVRCPDGTRLR
jgi:hypothetical protein